MCYFKVNEYPAVSVEQLVADIGGIMGLCIGGSFLSIIEVIELVYLLVYVKVRGNETKQEEMEQNERKFNTKPDNSNISGRSSTLFTKAKSFTRSNKVRQTDDNLEVQNI